ncbi:radical SAM protein [Patescibacteria group bacterium]
MLEAFKQRLPSVETVMRIFYNLFEEEQNKKPLVAAYYPTYLCNANCGFCSQSEYTQDKGARNPIDEQKQLRDLELIRQDCPNIYILGGEPSIHRGILNLLGKCSDLNFDVIGLNTNGIVYIPEMLETVNLLVFSLHSTDPSRIAEIYGRSATQTKLGEKVLENLRKYTQLADKTGTQVVVNAVITGDNIDEISKIADLCREMGIKLNVAPAVTQNGLPDESLGSIEYVLLIQSLIDSQDLMACSTAYLEKIKHFGYFKCAPNLVPGIDPDGNVIVPCPNLPNHHRINLAEHGGLINAIQEGRKQYGEFKTAKECVGICHKTCYMEGASIATVSDFINRTRLTLGLVLEPTYEGLPCDPRFNSASKTALRDANLFLINNRPFRDKRVFDDLEQFDDDTLRLIKGYFLNRIMVAARWTEVLPNDQADWRIIGDGLIDLVTKHFRKALSGIETVINRPLVPDFMKTEETVRYIEYVNLLKGELARRNS